MFVIVFSLCFRGLVSSHEIFFLMIRRPPRSTLDRSSAASDVYKRQVPIPHFGFLLEIDEFKRIQEKLELEKIEFLVKPQKRYEGKTGAVSYTHLRAHETVLDLVCRLLLAKKKKK